MSLKIFQSIVIFTSLTLSLFGVSLAQDIPDNEQQSFSELAENFQDFLGNDSAPVVSALRNGEPVRLSDDTAGQIELANAMSPMGYGEVSLTLGLAESLAGPNPSPQDIAAILRNEESNGILDLRDQRMGWGQIFETHGVTVGDVMSRLNANEAAQARQVVSRDRPIASREQSQRRQPGVDQGRSGVRPDLPDRTLPDRPDRPERPVQPDRPERPARPNLPNQ